MHLGLVDFRVGLWSCRVGCGERSERKASHSGERETLVLREMFISENLVEKVCVGWAPH